MKHGSRTNILRVLAFLPLAAFYLHGQSSAETGNSISHFLRQVVRKIIMKNSSRMTFIKSPARESVRPFLLVMGIILLSGGKPLYASDDEKELGFSKSYFVCMDHSEGITSAMLDCNGAEVNYQDKRLNTAYRTLMKILSPVNQKKMRQEERDWIKKRESTCTEPEDSGTAGTLNSAGCFLMETAKQANKLENLLKESRK